MSDLQVRFGQLVALHRRQRKLTQEALAEASNLSVDMISKIETGGTGVRFAVIERLASALAVDPAELFSLQGNVRFRSGSYESLATRLAGLADADLDWLSEVVEAILKRTHGNAPRMR